jgi:sulfate transport system ATP-binding protein
MAFSHFLLSRSLSLHSLRRKGRTMTAAAITVEGPLIGYARPHQLDLLREANSSPSLRARVVRVHAAGSQVRVDAMLDEGRRVEVLLSQERFRELALNVGETVYVTAKEIKVFEDDYAI